MAKICAPWTKQQQLALNRYQLDDRYHPFTCGKDSSHQPLIAQKHGWVCSDCNYRQDWAHDFMLRLGNDTF